MLRTFGATLLALLFAFGLSLAAEDKKDTKAPKLKSVVGLFESYKDEVLTLKVEGAKQEFKVPGETDVAFTAGKNNKKVFKANKGLKDIPKGTFAAVTLKGTKVVAVAIVVMPPTKDRPKDKPKEK